MSLSKSYSTSGDGRKIGTTIAARLTGTITAEKTDDTFTPVPIEQRLSTILAKQHLLREVFSVDGLFEIQGFDASPPMRFFAVVDSLDFSEGNWVDKSDYSISLHGNGIPAEDDTFPDCESTSESWTFEEGDLPRSWKATHAVSAKGKLVYGLDGTIPKLPWQVARDFVRDKLGVGWTTAGDAEWSPLPGITLASQSAVQPGSTNAWNRQVSETIDEAEGTYSLTESWTLSEDPWVEEYTVSARRVDESNVTTSVAISGTIHGLRADMTSQTERYANAATRWETVRDLLVGRCRARVGAGGVLNAHPVSYSVDHDEFNGTIQYQAEFDDRTLVNDTYETYTISESAGDEDYRTTVRIEGTIAGAVYLDDGPSKTIKYTRASLQWAIVKGLLFARVVQETGINTLKPFPASAQVTPDKANGTVSYSYEFNDQTPADIRNEYTVSKRYSREDGGDFVTIEGTITGMRTANAGSPFGTGDVAERYNHAVNYWNGISGNLLGVAAQYVNLQCINPSPLNTTTGFNPFAGTVSYSAEFASTMLPKTTGALTEVVSIQDEDATPLIAVIPVLGRPEGPVIQDLGSVKEQRRTLSIEIVMTPPKFGCTTSVDKPTVDISPYVPTGSVVYKEQDTNTWVLGSSGSRYTRTVSWLFQ